MPLRASLPLLMLAASPLAAQHRGYPPGPLDTIPRTVAEAEAHGRRHPVLPDTGRQVRFLGSPAGRGIAERKCTPAGDLADQRVGDFTVGPFLPGGAGYGKMWFIPVVAQHFGQPEVPLTVRAFRTDTAGGPGLVFRTAGINARGIPSGDWFYATGLTLPAKGTWLMVVTAGPNWGCLVFRMAYPVEERWSIDSVRRGS